MIQEEMVLVVDADALDGITGVPGLSRSYEDMASFKFNSILSKKFVKRNLAEQDETIKQIIPYVVIRRNGKILAYQRSKISAEGRLHNKWSVGIGGHINPCDDTSKTNNVFYMNALDGIIPETIEQYGILYDNSDSVGRVHVGIVFILDAPESSMDYPQPNEESIANTIWVFPEEANKLPGIEGWSKIVIEAMMSDKNTDSGS